MDTHKEHSTFTTMGGYAVIAVLIGAWLYSSQKKDQNRRSHVVKQPTKHADRDVVADVKKKTEKAAKPKPKPNPSAPEQAEPNVPKPAYNKEEAEKAELADKKADRDFARQLSNTHAGTKFNTKKSDDKRQKSVKQSKAQEIIPDKISAPSSTTGDADDDLSSQASPAVVAADSHGVSDMLEPVASGPSVLRLTGTDSAKKPKERKAKAAEPVETKKQRQNRKKAEAAKAAREEEEKERKIKLEQQRRTARIAEGRPAKDGSSFGATQNAWNSQPTNGTAPLQLLDTLEQQSKAEPPKAPAPATKAVSDPWSGLPSEEEQLEMIRQEDSWNEVKTKKKGKKKDAVEASAASSQPANGNSTPTAATTTTSARPANGTKKPVITSSSSSFAALTPEEADDDDEPEQEWDV